MDPVEELHPVVTGSFRQHGELPRKNELKPINNWDLATNKWRLNHPKFRCCWVLPCSTSRQSDMTWRTWSLGWNG
jgi:hypothetical protein